MSSREKIVYDTAIMSSDRDLNELITLLLDELGYSYTVLSDENKTSARLMIMNVDDKLLITGGIPACRCYSIIGISSHENEIPSGIIKKCCLILHRPLDFNKFKRTIREAYENAGIQRIKSSSENKIAESIELDASGRCVKLKNKSVQLTPNEYFILSRLIESRGNPVSREELSFLIGESKSNKTDVFICTLRRKLDSTFETRLVYTVRGKGYMIK